MDKRLTNIGLGVLVVGLIAYSLWSGRSDPRPPRTYAYPAGAIGVTVCDTNGNPRALVEVRYREVKNLADHEVWHVLQRLTYPDSVNGSSCEAYERRREAEPEFDRQSEIEAYCKGSKSTAHCAAMRKLKAEGKWILPEIRT